MSDLTRFAIAVALLAVVLAAAVAFAWPRLGPTGRTVLRAAGSFAVIPFLLPGIYRRDAAAGRPTTRVQRIAGWLFVTLIWATVMGLLFFAIWWPVTGWELRPVRRPDWPLR